MSRIHFSDTLDIQKHALEALKKNCNDGIFFWVQREPGHDLGFDSHAHREGDGKAAAVIADLN